MNELKNLLTEPTNKTPLIDFNQLTGELILSGKSIPENAAKVYEPVLNWVTEYIRNPRSNTNIRINFEYFNTSSSLWLVRILKVLTQIDNPDYVLIINLYLAIEDFEEIEEYNDIKDYFSPITDIFHNAKPSIGLKLYGIDDSGNIINDMMVFV